jgi:hypothetical protein
MCFCETLTKVRLKIPNDKKIEKNKEALTTVTAAKLETKHEEEELTNKPKKEKKKKKKTAGLIIPPKRKKEEFETLSPSATAFQRNNTKQNKKLASILSEASKSKAPQIKFNQFFK